MHCLTRLETLVQQNSLLKALRLFVICALTLGGTLAYGQTYTIPYLPKYQVLTVVYAPPGSASSVTYSNSESSGNSESISSNSSFSFGESITVGFQWETLWSGGSITDTISTGWATQNSSGNSISLTSTQGNSVATAGPVSSSLGVNHDNDVIYILLNPVIDTTASGPGTTGVAFSWAGLQYNSCDLTDSQFSPNVYQGVGGCDPNQYPFPDIIGIPVWCLKNPYYPGQSCVQWLAYTSRAWDAVAWGNGNNSKLPLGPMLTLQDYADILSADPFVTQTLVLPTQTADYYCHPTYGVNIDPNDAETVLATPAGNPPSGTWPANYCGVPSNGYVTSQRFNAYDQVQYPQPGVNGEPQTYSGTLSYQQTTGISSSSQNSESVGNAFKISGWGGFVGNGLSFSSDTTSQWTWQQSTATSQTQGNTNTASYSITGPQASDNYQGPVTFNVYQDNVFGTFAFYSDLQREQPPLQLSGLAGAKLAPNGLAISGSSFLSPILVNLATGGTIGSPLVAGTPYSFPVTVTACNPPVTCPPPDVQEIALTNNSPNYMTMAAPAVTFSDPGFQLIENNPTTYQDGCSNQYLAAGATCLLFIEFAPVLSDVPNPLANPNPVYASLIAAGTENITSYQNVLVTSTGLEVTGNAAPVSIAGATIRPATIQTASVPNLYVFPMIASTTAETETFTVTNLNSSAVTMSASSTSRCPSSTSAVDITLTDCTDFTISSDGCASANLKAATPPSGSTAGTAGGSCSFTLNFLPVGAPSTVPSTAGEYTAIITANGTIAGGSGAANLAVAGAMGTAGGISMSPRVACVFPDMGGGTTQSCTSTTITNNSSSTFTITGVTSDVAISGGPGTFTISAATFGLSGCTSGTIAAGKTCTGTLTFNYPTCSPTGDTCSASGSVGLTGTLLGSAVSTQVGASASWSNCVQCGAVVHITGKEQSKQVIKPATHARASVDVTGAVTTPFSGTRTVVLTVHGFRATASYNSTATNQTVAQALAAAANAAGSPVTAKASMNTVTLTYKTAGTVGNTAAYTATGSSDFTITPRAGLLSGGVNASTITEYDAGATEAAVGGVTVSSKWGKTSTSETIAAALAASMNLAGKGSYTATASGGAITITPASGKSAPSVSVGVKDSMGFNPASFSASAEN